MSVRTWASTRPVNLPGEGYTRGWPELVRMDEATRKLVDELRQVRGLDRRLLGSELSSDEAELQRIPQLPCDPTECDNQDGRRRVSWKPASSVASTACGKFRRSKDRAPARPAARRERR